MFVEESGFKTYFLLLSFLIPIMLACVGGIVWSGLNWKTASTPALVGLIACGVLLLFTCIFPAAHVWLPRALLGQNPGMGAFNRVMWTSRGITISSNLCTALCVGALVFAAFAARGAASGADRGKKKRDRDDDDDRPSKRSRDRDDDDDAISEKPAKKKRPRDDDDD
ncbi:MAG: hypothetical protein HYX68_03325 [Planctomycetes bacterium]|jgi:hypothetical protein|nr:hypothetical protein [Planctomycetota bacterium]